ncbi:hypothetical protein GGR57DRAFT_497988 [Xylariaceae sp. FL1272]|nr:hypothetical protein GGR57DRAFT_497988 [Xylariaceae sp. FL1272]
MANTEHGTKAPALIAEEFVDWTGDFFTKNEKDFLRKAEGQELSPDLERLRILQWNLLSFREASRNGLFPIRYLRLERENRLDTDERENFDNPLRRQLFANFLEPQNTVGHTSLTAQEVKDVVEWAKQRWEEHNAKERFRFIVEAIPKSTEINKVMRIGSGLFLDKVGIRKDGADRYHPVRLATLLAALSLANMLAEKGGKVSLYACSFDYDKDTKAALESIGFEILDAGYNKHEHYRLVDGNTLVWCTGLSPHKSILPQLAVGTWPAAMMLTDPYTLIIDERHSFREETTPQAREPSQMWSRMRLVAENEEPHFVAVPGVVGLFKDRNTVDVPFHTSEAGRMWDQFHQVLSLGGPELDISQFTFICDNLPFESELWQHESGSICRYGARLYVRKEDAQAGLGLR